MANPSAPAPPGHGPHKLAIHLADRALTPLISSSAASQPQADVPLLSSSDPETSGANAQAQSLSSLTTAAITAYDSAARLDLGLPQRILIETTSRGPVLLHSYLNPQLRGSSASQQLRPVSSRSAAGAARDIVGLAREDLRPVSSGTAEREEGQDEAEDEAGEEEEEEAEGSSTAAGEDEESHSEEASGEREDQLANGTLLEGGKKADTPAIQAPPGAQEAEDAASVLPPLLIATVVAGTAAGTMEARRAAAKLERMGREFQKEFVREGAEPSREAIAAGEDG